MACSQMILAQNDYYMTNGKVSDCKGNFFDSEKGTISGNYDHNENYIFTICVPGAQSITLTFSAFCTEDYEDYMIIFDGKDTFASKLSGKISGSNNPGSFTSSDSCLTIYFHSDVSVPCSGWEASWSTKVIPILPPKFIALSPVSCDDNVLRIKLDQKWNCDSLSAGNFTITGILNPSITNLTPINCDANNETDSFLLSLNPKLDRSGSYQIDFDAVKYDRCDSAWQLHSDTTFNITNCPIYVNLIADPDTVCQGTCTAITAEVTGGDSTKYNFAWSTGINGTFGPHTYCPSTSGWVYLTVSDGSSVPGTDSIWIEVVSPPVAQADTTVCESASAFLLTASPVAGNWLGKGITNTNSGRYDPQKAGAGIDTCVYQFAGCTDTVLVNITAFDAGFANASCPGASPFMVTGFSPAGGTWSGPNITSNGIFDPVDTGTYTVTYTWNGCTDTKTINVYPVNVQTYDTVCQSQDSLKLNFSPVGGYWNGLGFLDFQSGWFLPPRAGGGNKRLIYDANGCKDTAYVYVKPINARGNQIACPDAPPFNITQGLPTGGYWTGVGLTDTIKGTYDASFIYGLNKTFFNDTLYYHINGCVARKIVYVRQTVVPFDTLKFCIEAPNLFLDFNSTKRSPGGGVWSGNGVFGTYFFGPDTAGRGGSKIYYDANGCRDSLIMFVHPQSIIQNDTSICETDNSITLYAKEKGGSWAGKGTTKAGVFDPKIAKTGVHTIRYTSKNGCLDSSKITVLPRPTVKITGFNPIYCFKDSNFIIKTNAVGGVFSGTTFGDSLFNPHFSGTGNHKIKYQFGTATCYSADSVVVRVLDTLKHSFTFDDDSLCFGEIATLTAGGSRGSGKPINYTWSNSSSTDRTLFTRPTSSGWVSVTISDGCSDNVRDSVFIYVFPKIEVTAATSDTQCFGTVGWVEVNPILSDPYKLTWHTAPPQNTNRINAAVALNYAFTVQNLYTNCRLDSSIYIPSYPRIKAHFITSPAAGYCLNPFDPDLQIINYSVGATSGIWHFGDSTSAAYSTTSNLSHVYQVDTNRYTIWLYVQNNGGCRDSFSVEICVDDSVYLVIPNSFSPISSAGINDYFSVKTAGVVEFQVSIFNRWGEKIYHSTDPNFSWDGTYKGKPVSSGVYVYEINYKGKKTFHKSVSGTINVIR
ncbi:MAG: gliding motility-associated C-terminal domain-containing protein [Flavobacteriales bacterium]|nr:gliding motility-associated C-terminal domain-containing protein [Flavobacteriales bacterium]